MGGKNSSESGKSNINRPSSFNHQNHLQGHPWSSPYSSEMPYYQNYPPTSQSYHAPVEPCPPTQSFSASYAYPPEGYYPKPLNYLQSSQPHSSSSSSAPRQLPRLDRRYSKIADDYKSLDEVTEALAQAGLESSNLIVGIDFTKSNEWTGKHSFNRCSLHHIGNTPNPYEQAITIIGKTLSKFDEDNLIPCFGFGDASTHDQDIFSFYPDERPCDGFAEALSRYREIVPHLRLAGPTSFAPIIEMAMTIVENSGGQYHVLLIIADGQVTRSVDTELGQFSSQERKTVDAIVKASDFPLSIILVGVGDGPWDMMKEFDDNVPARSFDNFQFVNFTEIMSKNINQTRKDTEFALGALMEFLRNTKQHWNLGVWVKEELNLQKGSLFHLPWELTLHHLQATVLVRPLSRELRHPLLHINLHQALLHLPTVHRLIIRCVQYALPTQRTWLSGVDIRHAAIVGRTFRHVRFVELKSTPE